MEARKVQVKLFATAHVDVEPLVPVFHDWIRKNALNELLIDVTEYGHVHEGPALLLVGHESDYAIDFGDGRPGLLYSRKRVAPADARECVTDAIRRALGACRRIETEPSLATPIRFRTDELVFRINDRLLAPNDASTWSAVEPVLRDVLGKVYAGTPFTCERVGEPRELFQVRVKAPGAPSVADLLARIA